MENLTSIQQKKIKEVEKLGWKYVKTAKLFGKMVAVIQKGNDKEHIFPDGSSVEGFDILMKIKGFWMDPAGGIHPPQEDSDEFYDPAAMYENKSLNEIREPKWWNSDFAMKAIKAFQAGEFNLNDKKSILDWDTAYNSGTPPNPPFNTYDIVKYALAIGKYPNGTPLKENKSLKEDSYKVWWIDRDYKKHSKLFKDDPQGSSQNGLDAANKFKKALEKKDDADKYGNIRQIGIEFIYDESLKESDDNELIKKKVLKLYDSGKSQSEQYPGRTLKRETKLQKLERIVELMVRKKLHEAIDIGAKVKIFTNGKEKIGTVDSYANHIVQIKFDDNSTLNMRDFDYNVGVRKGNVKILKERPKRQPSLWNKEKYIKWLKSLVPSKGQEIESDYAVDMARNAEQENGLIDYVETRIEKSGGDESALERIQWDLEGYLD